MGKAERQRRNRGIEFAKFGVEVRVIGTSSLALLEAAAANIRHIWNGGRTLRVARRFVSFPLLRAMNLISPSRVCR